jgi:hypothetical protein
MRDDWGEKTCSAATCPIFFFFFFCTARVASRFGDQIPWQGASISLTRLGFFWNMLGIPRLARPTLVRLECGGAKDSNAGAESNFFSSSPYLWLTGWRPTGAAPAERKRPSLFFFAAKETRNLHCVGRQWPRRDSTPGLLASGLDNLITDNLSSPARH